MPEMKFIILMFAVIGVVFVVGKVIRAIGVSEFNLRLKFRNDNASRKLLDVQASTGTIAVDQRSGSKSDSR